MVPEVPDNTPCDIFCGGYGKDRVFVPTLPSGLADQQILITAAVKNIHALLLTFMWQELDFIEVCRFNRGAHSEHI
jgi:hypothetical protein